jgi:hypothetical protein
MSIDLLHGMIAVVFLLIWLLVWQIIVRSRRVAQADSHVNRYQHDHQPHDPALPVTARKSKSVRLPLMRTR